MLAITAECLDTLARAAAALQLADTRPASLAAAARQAAAAAQEAQDREDVLVMSAAYGSYMASSSNLRYQILAGLVEERGIEVLFKSSPAACAVSSFVYTKRGDDFKSELDFVFANLVMAIIADFMLVWLPAPTFATK
ncbi:hypothetical protein CHLNCDRAFT_139161 [Chlorella variabilis]|uniref:Uncharacterized protein n=1 Tax=Chlorella variabilis TaxID=554065 RepID=E1ZPK7_CHLVA|nr:hypothetical protein CHLNCDRAFT_139161 [Chlorella variabilis]EFN52257.1 hypothetical protein CHLNCDRAFT_139161 [Chlorella variabilis]|eukprot:XP_005844359.1 hypothetical protein CHLNCDRAFT_139161 [Chlorella variabilis]